MGSTNLTLSIGSSGMSEPMTWYFRTVLLVLAGSAIGLFALDRLRLAEARQMGIVDLKDRLASRANDIFDAPPDRDHLCIRIQHLPHYESQICYLDFNGHGVIGIVKYFEPKSRLRQWLYQSNDLYFSFVIESGETVASIMESGEIDRYGAGSE